MIRKNLRVNTAEIVDTVGGASAKTWERYERGENIPKADVLLSLVKLGFDANWILTGQGSMRPAEIVPLDEALLIDTLEFLDEEGQDVEPAHRARMVVEVYKSVLKTRVRRDTGELGEDDDPHPDDYKNIEDLAKKP